MCGCRNKIKEWVDLSTIAAGDQNNGDPEVRIDQLKKGDLAADLYCVYHANPQGFKDAFKKRNIEVQNEFVINTITKNIDDQGNITGSFEGQPYSFNLLDVMKDIQIDPANLKGRCKLKLRKK